MNKHSKPITGNSTLMRPRFSPGLLLRDDDLRQGVDYTRDLSRLLFRSLFGCGVVCGLEVTAAMNCGKLVIQVGSGVALDCLGDPIHVPDPQSIPLDPSCGDVLSSPMWVILRRTEKCCAPRSAACSCDDEDTTAVCTRERDCYEIRVVTDLPACVCPHPATTATATAAADPSSGQPVLLRKTKPKSSKSVAVEAEAEWDCRCADPSLPMYKDHYCGKCGCDCDDSQWVILASITEVKDSSTSTIGGTSSAWKPDHSVRRFVRPVLMRDPLVYPSKDCTDTSS